MRPGSVRRVLHERCFVAALCGERLWERCCEFCLWVCVRNYVVVCDEFLVASRGCGREVWEMLVLFFSFPGTVFYSVVCGHL